MGAPAKLVIAILLSFFAAPGAALGQSATDFQLLRASPAASNRLVLTFSAPVATVQSTNFTISPDATISSASIDPIFQNIVILETSSASAQTVSASNVQNASGAFLQPVTLSVSSQPLHVWDADTIVNGYQDDFASLSLRWVVHGDTNSNVYSTSNGLLHVTARIGDPNHLLYEAPGYDPVFQQVLMRIRVSAPFRLTDGGNRAGAALACDPSTNRAINYLFTGAYNGPRQLAFLNDRVEWSPDEKFLWATNTWYWMRVAHAPDQTYGQPDVFGKVWPADGITPEPTEWVTWDYHTKYSSPTRAGFAGITANSTFNGEGVDVIGNMPFDVDYFLLKAAGCPKIIVAPESLNIGPKIEEFRLETDGSITLTTHRPAGREVEIQTSGDLVNWQHYTTLSTSSPITIHIPTSQTTAFVRLIEKPAR